MIEAYSNSFFASEPIQNGTPFLCRMDKALLYRAFHNIRFHNYDPSNQLEEFIFKTGFLKTLHPAFAQNYNVFCQALADLNKEMKPFLAANEYFYIAYIEPKKTSETPLTDSLPDTLPVTVNFDKTKVIGTAKNIRVDEKGVVLADLEITDDKAWSALTASVAYTVSASANGETIHKFHSVSLVSNNDPNARSNWAAGSLSDMDRTPILTSKQRILLGRKSPLKIATLFVGQIEPGKPQICYKTNQPCPYNCSGLCKDA